jgi:23S rRNA (uridine2479-2'-O)-methyltransferase
VTKPRPSDRTIRRPNDEFQLLEALVGNRAKRHHQGRFLVQGVRAIDAALQSGWPVSSVLLSDTARSAWARALVDRAPGAEVVRVGAALLARLSERDEGAEALLVARILDRSPATLGGSGLVVVLEGVQNPGNLGTIFRSAAAFGASGLVVTGHCADPYDPRCVRASSGALFAVPFATAPSVATVAKAVAGRVVALHPAGRCLDEVDLSGSIILVAGNERAGLSRTATALSADLASVPVREPVDSLNVAVAVSVALAEIDRRRRSADAGPDRLRGRRATKPGVAPG